MDIIAMFRRWFDGAESNSAVSVVSPPTDVRPTEPSDSSNPSTGRSVTEEVMSGLSTSKFSLVEESEATGQVSDIYNEIRSVMEIPFVPNIHKGIANSPNVLAGTWDVFRNVFLQTNLPTSLASMILFSIAYAKNCQYCSAVHQVTCKTLGVEEETLVALQENLRAVAPERVQAIVRFAQKCALNPQGLKVADYDAVRDQGVSDEELTEVIGLAALANYLDTVADALKIDVDTPIKDALSG